MTVAPRWKTQVTDGGVPCDNSAVRILVAAMVLALVIGCSSTDDKSSPPAAESTPTAAPKPTPTAKSASAPDACDLLTTADLAKILEGAGDPKPGLTGGIPNCQWADANGRYVQAVGIDASEWVRSLPDIVRALEASKEFSDAENLRKLRAAAKLLESGDKIDSREACSLFSQMAELQGRPPKTTFLVSVIPTRADPKGISGQMCSVGTFTSVMLADTTGLEDPLPVDAVGNATKTAHRRAIG